MPTKNQYWYFLIGGPTDDINGLVTNFYAYGEHCGEALANALNAATEELGIIKPEATEAARLDILSDFEEPEGLTRFNEWVLSGPTNYSYPLDSSENDFIPPTGIIKATEEGKFDYELIKEGFLALHSQEDNSFELELIAGKEKLLDTFIQSLKFISPIDRLEINIKGHWHNQKSELWAINVSELSAGIESFLLDNTTSLLQNGFIECTAVVDSGSTKLTLNEHKKVCFQTEDEKLFINFGEAIMALGFEQTTELCSLEYGFYHWHYRPTQSLDAPELRIFLLDTGFNFVESWEDELDEIYPETE
ncbi:hypothetical protein FNT36_20510 [Hymenobacter setariae]|uniref:Uncharacterized protein n=1 Tax=Hymenobacter setariae TaxID=2594794 RepID=A0A558BPY6_9BACT|nr:hypothetical protein [Hymenobacter setariae]TVT38567.1 hypothetical protein FNT36_20510 [Hymenobacter setariae]